MAFHPDDRQATDITIQQAVATCQPFGFDHRVPVADGTMRVIRAKGTVILGKAGVVVRVTGTSQDVTELEKITEALRMSENRLAEAQNFAGLGSWEWNIEADRVTWSDELYALLGVDPRRSPAPTKKSWTTFTLRTGSQPHPPSRQPSKPARSSASTTYARNRGASRPAGPSRREPRAHIVITGTTEPDVELECLQLGVNDFVVKPFDLAVLEARMNNALVS